MCLADLGRIRTVTPDGAVATVECARGELRVSLAVLAVDGVDVVPGQWVECHLGLATRVLTPPEAAQIRAARADTTGSES